MHLLAFFPLQTSFLGWGGGGYRTQKRARKSLRIIRWYPCEAKSTRQSAGSRLGCPAHRVSLIDLRVSMNDGKQNKKSKTSEATVSSSPYVCANYLRIESLACFEVSPLCSLVPTHDHHFSQLSMPRLFVRSFVCLFVCLFVCVFPVFSCLLPHPTQSHQVAEGARLFHNVFYVSVVVFLFEIATGLGGFLWVIFATYIVAVSRARIAKVYNIPLNQTENWCLSLWCNCCVATQVTKHQSPEEGCS